MNFALDIDRAQSVFQLLFQCSYDSACADDESTEFDQAVTNIVGGVKLPDEVLPRLRRIHREVIDNPQPIANLAQQVMSDLGSERELLLSVVSILIRISSDESMLCARDRATVADVARCFDLRPDEIPFFTDGEQAILQSCLGTAQNLEADQALREHFATLGCSADCEESEVRRKYRELVMECHPDRSTVRGDTADRREQFERIHRAYESIRTAFAERLRYSS